MMVKHFTGAAIVAIALLAAQPAAASHIFFGNVQIDGVALDSAGGPTNPLFVVNVGDSLDFTLDGTGCCDNINVSISGVSGMSPSNFSFFQDGANNSFLQALTFNTVGSYNASAFIDIPSSFPDYSSGPCPGCNDTATLSFRVNVVDRAGAIPEPGVWALMIMGFGATGAMVRRRRSAFA